MTRAQSPTQKVLAQVVAGLATAPGGPVQGVVTAARSRLSAWTWTAIGLCAGAVAGLVLVLVAFAVPHIPTLLAGFVGGALLGSMLTVALASRYPIVRKGGAIAILLMPFLVLAAPFILVGLAVAALMRTKPKGSRNGGRRK